ncbi:MAG: HpsJ family protein [Drouetiella hepatica Uher 2000/2452]|uniref:HpsJ family protein n=1 Tax=Drouetiella hepatica Uher 2000/2452 TaxID=904376 RepID=A0A951UPS3_9CYAN|nr:HpsJ family protein [Drouetiella hepatica Uher 2000/2452]
MAQFVKPLHWIGYGLLILSLISLVDALVPTDLMNPVWEFQTMGAIIEQSPLILVGLFMVFLVDPDRLMKWDEFILKGLSWLALGVGLMYLLMIPLCIVDAVRVHRQANQQIFSQVSEKREAVQQVKDKLNQAKTVGELEQLLISLDGAGVAPEITPTQPVEQVKQKLAQAIAQGEQNLNAQAQQAQQAQSLDLLKKAVKWNLGALVSGLLFISIWRGTPWARQRRQNF